MLGKFLLTKTDYFKVHQRTRLTGWPSASSVLETLTPKAVCVCCCPPGGASRWPATRPSPPPTSPCRPSCTPRSTRLRKYTPSVDPLRFSLSVQSKCQMRFLAFPATQFCCQCPGCTGSASLSVREGDGCLLLSYGPASGASAGDSRRTAPPSSGG